MQNTGHGSRYPVARGTSWWPALSYLASWQNGLVASVPVSGTQLLGVIESSVIVLRMYDFSVKVDVVDVRLEEVLLYGLSLIHI